MTDLSEYPKELTKGRDSLEMVFTMLLLKELDLIGDYEKLNENGDETLKTADGIFYFDLGRQIYRKGYRAFDSVTVYSYLEESSVLKKAFDEKGGWKSVEEMMSLVKEENLDATYDGIIKSNFLMSLYDKGFNVVKELDRFKHMTYQQVYDYYDYILNNVGIKANPNLEIETLSLTDDFIKEMNEGEAVGVSYAKNCPILNSWTMGLPLGELYMIGAHSGKGKTSFVFENMILAPTENGHKCVVISNEQRSRDFRHLLLIHILTSDLNYYGLARKDLKRGRFTPEQMEMIKKAEQISVEKYGTIRFIKMFDNSIERVRQVIKKLSKIGYQVFMFDTMKSDDEIDEAMWQQLLIHSRKLFQTASKENISIVCTYQLALYTLNRRWLDASCLSNAKQIKEVFSEMIYMRDVWQDEMKDEQYDIKPYIYAKDDSGKTTDIKIPIDLDDTKHYMVVFLDKTRNDEDGRQVVYEFDGKYNKWIEKGRCKVFHSRDI